jgi:acyl-coenzyme A thioesterase PaaI-like protein
MHGGVITTAMDVSMGHLCHRFLSTAVTIEMNLRPPRLVAVGRRRSAHRAVPAETDESTETTGRR